jgi:hypothetical protein
VRDIIGCVRARWLNAHGWLSSVRMLAGVSAGASSGRNGVCPAQGMLHEGFALLMTVGSASLLR